MTSSEGAVCLGLFKSECQVYIVILSEEENLYEGYAIMIFCDEWKLNMKGEGPMGLYFPWMGRK
jgi:hypothetical protein